MSIYGILSNHVLVNCISFRVMLIIFMMVQMASCSEHKKLRGSVDLFNLFQWLAFEEVEPIITGC